MPTSRHSSAWAVERASSSPGGARSPLHGGTLIGRCELHELAILIDACVVPRREVVRLAGRDRLGAATGVPNGHAAADHVAPVLLLTGAVGQLGEQLGGVQARVPLLEGDD